MSIAAVVPDLIRHSAHTLEFQRIRHYLVVHRGVRSASGVTSGMFCRAQRSTTLASMPGFVDHDGWTVIQRGPDRTGRGYVRCGGTALNWEYRMSWTEERVDLLKKLLNDGMTASQIAKELGGVTRNAVIGKIHRLGLSSRPDQSAEASGTSEEAKNGPEPQEAAKGDSGQVSANGSSVPLRKTILSADQPLPPQPSANEVSAEALANVREVEMNAPKISLLELTERTCKWPIGDPATDEFWFCGLAAKPGKPYCEAHIAVAFQPPNSRRDRRR